MLNTSLPSPVVTITDGAVVSLLSATSIKFNKTPPSASLASISVKVELKLSA